MTCDPKALLQAAACYRCIPKPVMQSTLISLLCHWANNLTPPVPAFSWVPDTEIMRWIDSGGVHNGDLATFRATADFNTVTTINAALSNIITEINHASTLPALTTILCSDNNIDNLDVSGCLQLQRLDCYTNGMSTLNLSGCTLLQLLNCEDNDLTTLDLSDSLLLQSLTCGSNNIDALDLSGHAVLIGLDCSNNGMSTLNLTGCVFLQIIQTDYNPGLIVTV